MATHFFSRYKNYSIQVQVGLNKVTCNFTPWGEFGHFFTDSYPVEIALMNLISGLGYGDNGNSFICPAGKDFIYSNGDDNILPDSSESGTIAQPFGLTSENFSHFLNNLPEIDDPSSLICYKDGVKKTPAESFAFNNRFVHKFRTTGGANNLVNIEFPEGLWVFSYIIMRLVSHSEYTSSFSLSAGDLRIGVSGVSDYDISDLGYTLKIKQVPDSVGIAELNVFETSISTVVDFSPYKDEAVLDTEAIFDHYLVFERIA